MNGARLRLVAELVLVGAFCVAPLASAQTPNPLSFLGSILSPKPAALSKLIEEGRLDEADRFLGSEKTFFQENKQTQAPVLQKLAIALNGIYEPRFLSAEQKLVQSKSTATAREDLTAAASLVAQYKSLNIFLQPESRSQQLSKLEAAISETLVEHAQSATVAFQKFDHFGLGHFFDDYPIPLDAPVILNSSNLAWIDTLSLQQLKQLKEKYGKQISDGPFMAALSARYFSTILGQGPQPPSLPALLTALKSAKESGFAASPGARAKIAFVEITSKTLLKEGQIEFPTQVEMDLPFDAKKVDVDEMLEAADRADADFVVVLDVAAARAARRIVAKNDVDSRYVSGTRTEPNPDYEIARSRVFEAQSGLANAQGTYAQGVVAAILKVAAVAAWSGRVSEANSTLASTPSMLHKDIFSSYKYSASDVNASRNLTANYYVIEKKAGKYFKGIFGIAQAKSFRISYNLHDKDPERGQILNRFDKETEIASYEQSPMTLPVSSILDDYIKNEGQAKALGSIQDLRTEMLTDKNKALAEYKTKQFDAKPMNDNRFESVVVVLNPKGPVGAGFYVAPDLVMTNFHVIEGARFIEMRLRNGLETFGKVVKTDVRLDLALVKVQTVGKPVSLFEGNTLELGATVEAIGHPQGLTFTLTRGIVSALRKQQSIYGVGGKDVLFVQTDAAINPGNSGGPLFWQDKVIGVNNNKMVRGAEGLGFAIHYSEIAEFLKESF